MSGHEAGVSSGAGPGVDVGLDIGATKSFGVVVDAGGTILASHRLPTRIGARGIVETAVEVVECLREAHPAAATAPVGIGIPGLVDVEQGAVSHAVNLGLDGTSVPLRALLDDRLRVRTALENDVNAATLGAVAVTGEDDLAYLSIGTGLAAGIVLDGRLRRGSRGAAGEIGHVPVDPEGRTCRCGQRGCLETVASGAALDLAWPTGEPPTAPALVRAAEAGDPLAVDALDRFAQGVAAAVRTLALAVDVRTVVLGGGVAQVGDVLRDRVVSVLREQARNSPFLESLELADRLRLVPPDVPVAALGAALLNRPRLAR